MSTAAAVKPPPTTAPESPPTSQPREPLAPGDFRVGHVTFNDKNMNMWNRDAADKVTARADGQTRGIDIVFVAALQSYRFDRYDGGAWQDTKFCHVTGVKFFQLWGLGSATPVSASAR